MTEVIERDVLSPPSPASAGPPSQGRAGPVDIEQWKAGTNAFLAWLLIAAITPLGVLASVIVGGLMAWNEADTGIYAGIGWWLLDLLICVAAPTAALLVAIQAARWGSASGRVALAVSGLIVLLSPVLLVYLVGLLWCLAWWALTGVLVLLVWRFGSKPSGPRSQPPALAA